jgi:hypothetical protein
LKWRTASCIVKLQRRVIYQFNYRNIESFNVSPTVALNESFIEMKLLCNQKVEHTEAVEWNETLTLYFPFVKSGYSNPTPHKIFKNDGRK